MHYFLAKFAGLLAKSANSRSNGLLVFLVWFGRLSLAAWRSIPEGAEDFDTALARAASIAIVLLMMHSVVEFPLRTTALMVVFAIACGLLASHKRVLKSRESHVEPVADDAPYRFA